MSTREAADNCVCIWKGFCLVVVFFFLPFFPSPPRDIFVHPRSQFSVKQHSVTYKVLVQTVCLTGCTSCSQLLLFCVCVCLPSLSRRSTRRSTRTRTDGFLPWRGSWPRPPPSRTSYRSTSESWSRPTMTWREPKGAGGMIHYAEFY